MKGGRGLQADQSMSPSTPSGCGFQLNPVAPGAEPVNELALVVTDEQLLRHTESCTPAKDEIIKSHGKQEQNYTSAQILKFVSNTSAQKYQSHISDTANFKNAAD